MKLFTAALVAAAVAVATGCGGSDEGDDGAAASGKATGTIQLWVRDSQEGFMQPLADAYNETHEAQVKVTVIPVANFVQKFGTAAASGSGPDVASIDLIYVPYFASVGVLEDITDRAKALPYFESGLSEAHKKLAEYEGKVYALPFTAEASVMFYNKDLFKRAGLDPDKPPANYAEMEDAAKKISALGKDFHGFTFAGACGGCNIFEFAPHVWASGGEVLSEDGAQAMLDSQEVTDALELYRGMWEDGIMPSSARSDVGNAQTAGFQSGKVGMINLGAFFLQPLKAEAKFEFDVAPIPGKDGGDASFAGGDEIAVTSKAKNKTAAWDFVKWSTSDEAQTVLADNSVVPVRTDLLDKIYVPKDPRHDTLAEAMADGKTPYSVVENELFNDNNGVWATMINKAVFTGDVAGAQAEAQEKAQGIIDGAR
jgi:multiple sugar transport system substrate-binding protein